MTHSFSPEVEAELQAAEMKLRDSIRRLMDVPRAEIEARQGAWVTMMNTVAEEMTAIRKSGGNDANLIMAFIAQHEADGSMTESSAIQFIFDAYQAEDKNGLSGLAMFLVNDYLGASLQNGAYGFWKGRAGYAISEFKSAQGVKKSQDAFSARIQAKQQAVLAAGKKLCGKCGGSGIYAMWIENGIPRSHTGTTCWRCGGSGADPQK